jgi:Entner-Doudoroff aldolase
LIRTARLIAIMRGNFVDRYSEVVATLSQAGIVAIEMSLVSTDAYKILTRLVQLYGSDMAIGGGTVTTVEQVERVRDSGVSFIISPNLKEDVVEATLRNGLVSIPGAYTPSEIARATDLGADAVKLFPASSLEPSFVHAVRGPFPHLRLVPTGGIGLKEIPLYLKVGAWAVAAGSELLDDSHLSDHDLLDLGQRARLFAAAAKGE